MKAYKATILFTPSPSEFKVLAPGYVLVRNNGTIAAVGEWHEGVIKATKDESVELIDLGDQLLIPAMNDLHVHAPQYANLGIAMDLELLPWLNTYTFPEEMRYADKPYAERLYRRFVSDLVRYGTMRAAVFATIHAPATQLLCDLFQEAGIGGKIGLVGMNRNCPTELSNTTQEAISGTLSVLEHTATMPLVDAIVTPRFVPSCTPDMLAAMGQLAAEKQLPVQSHLSENRSEIAWVKQLDPEASCYADAYRRFGLFGQTPTLMAHCCYPNREEMRLMRENPKTMVVHCPTSNCNLSSGIAPIRQFLEQGTQVALGSDISGGSHLSIFRVMQYAMQMSKLQYSLTNGRSAFLTLSEVFHMATKAGGSFFGNDELGHPGSFEQGYAFDALVLDDSTLRLSDSEEPLHRLERLIYLGDDRHITKRFCQGHVVEMSVVGW